MPAARTGAVRPSASATGRRCAPRSSRPRWRQLAESGPAGISISAIGKQLGVSGPALYRYFASRDELLTELVIDAYHDLADALTAATSHVAEPMARAPSSRPSPAPTAPGPWPSRTATGCCSGRRCPATTHTRNGSSRRPSRR